MENFTPASNLTRDIKEYIENYLEYVTDEEKEDFVNSLMEVNGGTALTFDIAKIMGWRG